MKNNNQILFIGLNAWAGAGKDTVAKALAMILEHDFKTYDEFKSYYDEHAGYATKMEFQYATFNKKEQNNTKVMCIAFADKLKQICADLFGVSLDRFYYNKENAYICVNKDFEYTEQTPYNGKIITADEFFYENDYYSTLDERCYMSLREILVYIGTYVIQNSVNRSSFINSVNNTVNTVCSKNDNLKYVICTDVRFLTEFNFIRDKHGVMIHIDRPGLEQLDNIAEKSLASDLEDVDDDWDFVMENNGTYDDLFKKVWNMVHDNVIFSNKTYKLDTRDDSNNYIRQVDISEDEEEVTFELCNEYPLSSMNMNDNINMIDPQGGPIISKDDELIEIDGTSYFVDEISVPEDGERPKFLIKTYKLD